MLIIFFKYLLFIYFFQIFFLNIFFKYFLTSRTTAPNHPIAFCRNQFSLTLKLQSSTTHTKPFSLTFLKNTLHKSLTHKWYIFWNCRARQIYPRIGLSSKMLLPHSYLYSSHTDKASYVLNSCCSHSTLYGSHTDKVS